VAFLGFKENIRDYIAALDVLAIPSLYEGLPYVLLESMSSGAPVIAARVGGIREILEHKKDSLLIEPGNDRELAETIRFLYNHPKVRIRLARDAFEKVNDSFMVGNMASLYLTLYRKVCSGHSSTTHVPKILTEHPLSCPCHEDSNNELRPHQ
jgi:glycosyltransferase involved in cell wall biosynthesis